MQGHDFTIAFWAYNNDDGDRSVMFATTPTSGWGISIEKTTGNTLRVYWQGNPDIIISDFTLPVGEWVHIAETYTNNSLYVYKNGEKVYERLDTVLASNLTNTWSYASIGRDTRTGSTAFKGKLNDFRWYDHALSPREVKEISKGLVCHYTLSGIGGENLSNFSSYANNWVMENLTGTNYTDDMYGNVIKLTTTAVNQRMYHNVHNIWVQDQKYAVSFLAKTDTPNVTCDMSRSVADYSERFNLSENWKKYTGIITCTTTNSGGTLSFRINQANVIVYITQIKLEYGTIATPYIPHSSDPEYTKMGLNDGIEYDVSGYRRNGTKYDSFKYTTDTPRYITAIEKTDNTKPAIQIPTIWETGTTVNELTLSCWHKTDTANNNTKNIINLHGNAFLRFGLYAASTLWVFGNSSGINAIYTLPSSGADNVWHLYTLTFKDGILKAYFDGEIIGTKDFTSTTQYLTVAANSSFIGAYLATGSEITPGSFSDARVYATALSAEDILVLYNNPVSLSSNGALLTQGEVTE